MAGQADISAFFVVCSVVMIIVQIWGYPRLTRWSGQRRTPVLAFVAVAAGLTIMPFGGSALWIGFSFALAGGGTGIVNPALATLISNATAAPGQALGWQAAAANLGQAVAAAPAAPFLVTAAVLAGGALVALRT